MSVMHRDVEVCSMGEKERDTIREGARQYHIYPLVKRVEIDSLPHMYDSYPGEQKRWHANTGEQEALPDPA